MKQKSEYNLSNVRPASDLISSLKNWCALVVGVGLRIQSMFMQISFRKFGIWLVLLAIPLIILCAAAINTYQSVSIFRKIDRMLQNPTVVVYINGSSFNDLCELQRIFSNRQYLKIRSGSHPEFDFDVSITTREKSLNIRLAEDSREKNMYWVYFFDKQDNELFGHDELIGFVRSDVVIGKR